MKSIAVALCMSAVTSEGGTEEIRAENTIKLTSYTQESMLRSQ